LPRRSGRLSQGAGELRRSLSYDITVKASQVNLAAVQKSAAGFLPEGVGLDGGLSVDLTAEQKPIKDAKPTLKGEIVLRNAAMQTKSMRPVLDGAITLSPDRNRFPCAKARGGRQHADITGQVLNYATSPNLRIDVTSAMLNLDSLMPFAAPGAATGAAPAAKKNEKEFGPLKSKVRAEGNADIKRMVFKGITVQKHEGALSLPGQCLHPLHAAFRRKVLSGQLHESRPGPISRSRARPT